MLKSFLLPLLGWSSIALNLDDEDSVCSNYTVSGPIRIRDDHTVIENTVIYADPADLTRQNDQAVKIVAEHVTLRNVVIYHAANAMGIYGYNSHNLTLENVKVISYGNPWGANPCPTRKPFLGQDCSNIKILGGYNTRMDNVHVENGSRGISCVRCADSHFTNIVAKNARGPYPGGSALQFTYADNSIIEGFSVLAELDIAW